MSDIIKQIEMAVCESKGLIESKPRYDHEFRSVLQGVDENLDYILLRLAEAEEDRQMWKRAAEEAGKK